MEFQNEKLKCKFTVPDSPTVRQQLLWHGAAIGVDPNDRLVRFWEAARLLITKWECEHIKDHEKVDLDQLTDRKQTDVIIWVGNTVLDFMVAVDDIPKNS